MILLAIDTSGKNGSLALARVRDSTTPDLEILELVPLEGGTFSAQLVPQIASVLKNYDLRKPDISAFAVVSGPGSFTGLRVGLAAIKALAEILQKPIAAVSKLEAVARSGSFQGEVASAIDAGRGEVYVGEYLLTPRAQMCREQLLSREEFLALFHGRCAVTPDPVLANAAKDSGLIVEQVADPRADVIARIGWEKIQSGVTISPEDLEANYIRRSDAEIFAKHP
jgi:tRNA threonylcarbamoyladenosine biosynthesis protein TsaB